MGWLGPFDVVSAVIIETTHVVVGASQIAAMGVLEPETPLRRLSRSRYRRVADSELVVRMDVLDGDTEAYFIVTFLEISEKGLEAEAEGREICRIPKRPDGLYVVPYVRVVKIEIGIRDGEPRAAFLTMEKGDK